MLSRTSKESLIRRVPLFASCTKREVAEVAKMSTETNVVTGETVISQGDETREFYVMVSGGMDVTKNGTHVASMGPGDFFGEIAMLLGAPRNATVTASSPSHLLVIEEPDFFRLLHETDGLHRKVINALAERIVPSAL